MNVWNTPERIALRDMVTSFTEKEIAPHLPAWEDAGLLPRELHQKAADVGTARASRSARRSAARAATSSTRRS